MEHLVAESFQGHSFFIEPSALTDIICSLILQRDVELLTFWAIVANPTQAFYNLIQVPVVNQYLGQVQVEVSYYCMNQ